MPSSLTAITDLVARAGGLILSAFAQTFSAWAFITFGCMAWTSAAHAEPAVIAKGDGMTALLSLEGEEAVVRWRFLRPSTPPLRSVALHLNGQALVDPRLEAVVDASDPPPVLVLFDVSNAGRSADLRHERARALRFVERARGRGRSLDLAAYAEGQAHLLPRADTAALLAALGAQSVEPNLRRAIETAIPLLPESRWRRRGLYVFTDGRGSSGLDVEALVRSATATGTAITFVLPSGSRTGDRDALGQLAAETGGFLIADETAFAALLREPFGLLDTGAMLRYSVKLGPHYIWDDRPVLKAIFSYDGNRRTTLRLSPDVREAGWFESLGALLLDALDLIVLVLLTAGLVTGIVVLVRRRIARRDRSQAMQPPPPVPASTATSNTISAEATSKPDAEPAPPGATLTAPTTIRPSQGTAALTEAQLVNAADGTIHPIGPGDTRIGRSRDNDLRLADITVSHAHAVLTRLGPRRYRITNLSKTNPTLLNGQSCTEAILSNGDVLSFGATELRFQCVT